MESGEPISGSNPGTTDVKIKEIPHQKRHNWHPKEPETFPYEFEMNP